MKVVDLLNKIANDETIPEYICLYNENDEQFHTVLCCEENIVHYLDDKGLKLNDEIKLDEIEKNCKIERIDNYYYHKKQDIINEIFQRKINEIINIINESKV